MIRVTFLAIIAAIALSSCSSDRESTDKLVPDCTNATIEERQAGDCVHRSSP